MCKIDKKLIEIVNKFQLKQIIDECINYINDKCYRPSPMDPLFRYLFYRNKDVQKNKKKLLSHLNEELIVIDVINTYHNKKIGFVAYEKKMRLPLRILIKCNFVVEQYVGNYNCYGTSSKR